MGPHSTFQVGDVFISIGGAIQWRLPDWTLNATLGMGGGYATALAFDQFGNLWAVDQPNDRLLQFDSSGVQVGQISGGMTNPWSIAADDVGGLYVGEHQWNGPQGRIHKFDLEGNLLAEIDVPPTWMHSVDAMDLEPDGCTLHWVGTDDNYVGGDDHVHRYDVCYGQELSVVGGRYANKAYDVIALPDGGDLAAILSAFPIPEGTTFVTRWESDPGIYGINYYIAGASWLIALDLAPSGAWYWVGDYNTGAVFKVETATGAVLGQFSTGSSRVRALRVFRGGTLPDVPPPPETEFNPPYVNGEDAGDPVSTLTGSFSDSYADAVIPGRGPAIEFARSYNSNDTRVTSLGAGWTHSYNIRLVDPGDGSSDVVLIGPQGRSDRYVWTGTAFTPPSGVHRTLVRNPDDTYIATDRSQTAWLFGSTGRLTQIRDRYGNASNLTYDANGRLGTISDAAGRGVLTLAYTSGKLTSVTDWASPARTVTYQYDANGRLWTVTDREGRTTTYTYDGTSQRITSITDARGNLTLATTYDAQGRVATQKDARGLVTGEVTTFDYVVNPDASRVTTITALPTSFEPSFQPTLQDTYDPNGWLIQRVIRPSSAETLTQTFTYDAAGNRTSVTDPRGNRADFCYDVDYAGNPIPGGAANLTRRIDPPPTTGANRPVTLLAYDAKTNVIQTVAPKGVPSGPTVTCSSDLSAVTGTYVADFTYDAAAVSLLSLTTRFTDPDSGLQTAVTKYEYADSANPGFVTRIIPPRGNTGPNPDYTFASTLTYYTSGSRAGLLQDVTDPLGSKVSYDYDPVGRLISVVDPLGNAPGGVPADHTAQYSYDREDRPRFEALPAPKAGGTALVGETRYDEVGNPVVRIDPNGQVTTFAYDERNSLALVTESIDPWLDPANPPASVSRTEYDHDAGGNVTRITRAAGDSQYERVIDYTHDGRGLLRREIQYPEWPSLSGPLVTTHTYDPTGNLFTVVDPLGHSTTSGYDNLDRRVSVDYSDPATPDVAYGYDAHGNRTSMTDGTGSTSYTYDEADRLVSVTSPGPETVGYRYDLDGNRTKLIYPDATAVSYTFDKADQLSVLTDWAFRSVAYTYWPDGLVKSATNPNASVETHTYDNARRLVEVMHRGPSGALLDRLFYTLDAAGNVTGLANGSFDPQFARPDGLSGSSGTWAGTYADINEVAPNDASFLASPAGPSTSNFYEVTLSDVEPPGDLTRITIRYRYAKSGNDAGQTINLTVELRQGSTVVASQSHTSIPGASGSGWQQGSLTLTLAQASAITNFVDLRLRFRSWATGGGQKRKAQVSWAEVQFPGPGDPTSLISYAYDRLYRLYGVTGASGTRSYTYDPVGNRLTRVEGGTTTYSYDRADRVTAAGSASVTVDANGNLVAKGADTFAYDQANRLTSATVGGAAETYAYHGDGVRFSRAVGSNPPARYVTDVGGSLPVILDDGTRKYVYGLGLAYAVSGSSVEVYHADRLGSVRALSDATGAVIATYRTDEWGIPTQTTGTSTQPFRYTGEPQDATGLVYLRARYYDPDLGRFTNRDRWPGSTTAGQTLNRYSYVANNPTTDRDPSGACVIDTAADFLFIGWDVIALLWPGKEEQDLLAFGADAGAAAIPCVTGAGIWVRGGIKWIGAAAKGFGPLSRAAEFGIRPYLALQKALKGTGLQAHHIIEKRFARALGVSENQMASVALTPAEHQALTNAWRALIPYGEAGTGAATRQQVMDAARQIYRDYPAILDALGP